jgi:hypothetical protein
MVLEPLQCGADAPAVYLAGHPPRRMLLAQHVPARVVIEILGHSQIVLVMNTFTSRRMSRERWWTGYDTWGAAQF